MSDKRISIAVSALGGQGGGVLSNWIVSLAEANGYRAQYTSISGVAQRTGTTIYAIELYPEANIKAQEPVLALMPVAGDVDICIAAELMEAGRAVNRGIVTPDKTTLIASDHRVFAISEKEDLGDGRMDSDAVRKAIEKAAKKLVLFDMDEMVLRSSSVISSVLFGALAGSGALPFSRAAYEDTIRGAGREIESNLAGFAMGYDGAEGAPCGKAADQKQTSFDAINDFPESARAIITYGVHKLVDYQDANYAKEYLERLKPFKNMQEDILTETARHLALWMCFEDVIRVADLKTRAGRLEKIKAEVRATDNQIWYGHDYFHPRYAEFCDTLPAALGIMVRNSATWKKTLSPFFKTGRIIRPQTIAGYLMLRFVANLRGMRRGTLRFSEEERRIKAWLLMILERAADQPGMALEIAKAPRLIKGYGDTHARGINHFSRIMTAIDNGASVSVVRELRDAALLNDNGKAFNDCILNNNISGINNDKGEASWAGSS